MVGFLYLVLLLLVLPIFLFYTAATVFFLIQLVVTRRKEHLSWFAVLWAIPFSLFLMGKVISWLGTLTYVDQDRIIGTYEVDTDFYPGPNADWQKEHFRFEIAKGNKFIFYVRLADGTEREYIGRVNWAYQRVEKWSVDIDEPYKIVNKYPTLYRGYFSYYYVLETKDFGNMFFRKTFW